MKKMLKVCLTGVYIGTVAIGYCALPALDTPTANVTEKWNASASNWGTKNGYSPESAPGNCWSSNKLSVSLSAAQRTEPLIIQIAGGTNASGGQFVGDYNLKKIESVEFDVMTSGLTLNPKFVFEYTKPGYTACPWIYQANVIPCDTGSEWVHVSIPMAFSTTWVNGDYSWAPSPTPVEAKSIFNEDKGNVVGLRIQVDTEKNILTSQSFSMTNLKLVGPWGGPFTNGISVAWLQENGLDLANALNNKDNFGRPLDLAFFACTNPNDSNDVFRIEIGRNADGKTVLKWKENNRYVKYDLLVGTDLTDTNSFQGVPGHFQKAEMGSGTQEEVNVDAVQVTGPRFYKVNINVP